MNGNWTSYPTLRENLAPQYSALSDEQIDALVAQVYGEGFTGEDLEGFFDDVKRGLGNVAGAVGNFAQKAAPVVKNALPGIAQGAMAGSALGPWGALAGAIAGGAGSALSQSKNKTLSGIGRGLGTATQLASSIRGGGAAGGVGKLLQGGLSQLGGRGGALGGVANLATGAIAQLGRGGAPGGALGNIANAAMGGIAKLAGGQGAPPGANANALLGMLARPEVGQALMSAAMGGLGRQSVQIGGNQVGVQSILGALGNLAGRAAGEMQETYAERLPEYFYDQNGELAIDPAESHQRTDRLLTLMALTSPIWAVPRAPQVVVVRDREDEFAEPEYTEADAEADAALWAEIYEGEYQEGEAYA
jgi:hypothetical protein